MNHPYPPLLEEIQREVCKRLGVGFDHVMLNWYQDGSVHIGKHRDVRENQVSRGSRDYCGVELDTDAP
jgi:hypothetical protein